LDYFENEKFRFVKLNKLMGRQMKENETVDAYAQDIIESFMALNVSQSDK
jgi:hypothetical protein